MVAVHINNSKALNLVRCNTTIVHLLITNLYTEHWPVDVLQLCLSEGEKVIDEFLPSKVENLFWGVAFSNY